MSVHRFGMGGVSHSDFMRRWLVVFLFRTLSLFAAATFPSLERSNAVFSGQVLTCERVSILSQGRVKEELWKAEVKVRESLKGDASVGSKIFVFYPQDWSTNYVGADGVSHFERCMQACPGRPRIATKETYRFYCVRVSLGDFKNVLYVPEGGWVVRSN